MIIGITGGVGCGKSTAVEIFGELGYRTLDSDELVCEVYAKDLGVKEAVREHFGSEAIGAQGEIDKKYLARRVFGDREELMWLENLVHPRVKVLRDRYIGEASKESWVVEIPLLFEKNLENEFDIIICLSARNDLQLSRLSRRGISIEDAKSRIASQLPLEQKEKRADYVIYNNENIEALRAQICGLVEVLRG